MLVLSLRVGVCLLRTALNPQFLFLFELEKTPFHGNNKKVQDEEENQCESDFCFVLF